MNNDDRDMIPYAPTVLKLLDNALGAMNHAVRITVEQGPAEAMEYIADYLNDTDGVDEEVEDEVPDNWLTQWKVTKA